MIHSCNPSPPLPRGLSRLCSGPAPNPSREIEKLSTLSLLNVASYLAMLFAAQHPCSTHPCGITPLHIACTASVVVLIQCVWNYTASAAELRNNALWTATIRGNFFPEMTSLIRPSPSMVRGRRRRRGVRSSSRDGRFFRGLRFGGRPLSRRRSFSRRLRSLSTLARSSRSRVTRRISASENVQRPPSFRPISRWRAISVTRPTLRPRRSAASSAVNRRDRGIAPHPRFICASDAVRCQRRTRIVSWIYLVSQRRRRGAQAAPRPQRHVRLFSPPDRQLAPRVVPVAWWVVGSCR